MPRLRRPLSERRAGHQLAGHLEARARPGQAGHQGRAGCVARGLESAGAPSPRPRLAKAETRHPEEPADRLAGRLGIYCCLPSLAGGARPSRGAGAGTC
eukprot:1681492-Alexandrium_andersonii.AAC.1